MIRGNPRPMALRRAIGYVTLPYYQNMANYNLNDDRQLGVRVCVSVMNIPYTIFSPRCNKNKP